MTERNPTDGPGEDPGPEHDPEHGRAGEDAAAAHHTESTGPESEPVNEEPGRTDEGDRAPRDTAPPVRREPVLPEDEEAAWAAIVAGYGREPDDPAPADDAGPEGSTGSRPGGPDTGDGRTTPTSGVPLHGFTVYTAGNAPSGPAPPDDEDPEDEGHFVPPEPPPLPETDPTTKLAWLAAAGGPLLLLACIMTGTTPAWWLWTLGIGGFLGGFAALVSRMRDEDDDGDDPGRGAVV